MQLLSPPGSALVPTCLTLHFCYVQFRPFHEIQHSFLPSGGKMLAPSKFFCSPQNSSSLRKPNTQPGPTLCSISVNSLFFQTQTATIQTRDEESEVTQLGLCLSLCHTHFLLLTHHSPSSHYCLSSHTFLPESTGSPLHRREVPTNPPQ